MEAKFNEMFSTPASRPRDKSEALAHYTDQLALAQYETLVRVWEASRHTLTGVTAETVIKSVQSTRSSDIEPKAVEDFKYHVQIIEFAEARA